VASAATEILILQSHDSAPYRQTLAGFQSGLESGRLDAVYQTLILSSHTDDNALYGLLQNPETKLILTLGTPATRAALARVSGMPIVAGLVLDTGELSQNPRATGVGLNFPASLQWIWLRRLLPDARQIAVLYDPRQGLALFQELQKQARVEGIMLMPAPISVAEDLPALMQNLPPQLDALWAVDGASAYSAAAVRELLLYSFRNRVPLVGLSAQWVKAGALYALDWDYQDLGAQLADLARDILLKGISPASMPPLAPRKVRAVLNAKTAEHMKLQIAERWLPELSEVIP
jgi:putative ABC transport system substrate-binding protein